MRHDIPAELPAGASGTDVFTEELRMRMAVVSELFVEPYDEGFKKSAREIARALERRHNVQVFRGGSGAGNPLTERSGFRWCVKTGRETAHFGPEATIYIPAASISFFSFVRARLLRLFCRRGVHAMIGLQPRGYSSWKQRLLPVLAPDVVLVGTVKERDRLAGLGVRAARIPLGIDLETFRPVDSSAKAAIRTRYGWPEDRAVVLHIGHLKAGRNLEALAALAETGRFAPVLAASTSTEAEPGLRERLVQSGVQIIDSYVESIEELYQASDVYFFPVMQQESAISFPLSVLEAMGCGLPVVSTSFGALDEAFGTVRGLVVWDGKAPLEPLLTQAMESSPATREAAERFSWEAVGEAIEDCIRSVGR